MHAPQNASGVHSGVANGTDESGVTPCCARCNRSLAEPRPGQRFCSDRCRGLAWRVQRQAEAATQRTRDGEVRALLLQALGKLDGS